MVFGRAAMRSPSEPKANALSPQMSDNCDGQVQVGYRMHVAEGFAQCTDGERRAHGRGGSVCE